MKRKSNLSTKIQLAERELGQFKLIMPNEIKPNFSAVARQTGLSRHTVARIWKDMNRNSEEKSVKVRKKRKSKFEPYRDEIIDLIKNPNVNLKAAFKFLQHQHGKEIFNSYDSFKSYIRTNNLLEYREKFQKANPRFETDAGKQVQFDWKESMSMELDTGEIVDFNLFSAVFSFSRFTVFIYSKTKTTEDLIRCLIQFVERSGGLPREFLTDNMSAIVSVKGGSRTKTPSILQLEKDMDTSIRLCGARKPVTKGKVESANRFAAWLAPYQGKLHTEQELIDLIEHLNTEINLEACETTKIRRVALFNKEKEYLRPLPSKLVLESYVKDVSTQKVPTTLLVKYKGSGYSVPKKYIGKRVKLVPIEDELYIYYNSNLIAAHKISSRPMNYRVEDYTEALRDQISPKISDGEVSRRAEENLRLLDRIGKLDDNQDPEKQDESKQAISSPEST